MASIAWLRSFVLAMLLAAPGCATLKIENAALPNGATVPATTPTRWRLDRACMQTTTLQPGMTREGLARLCVNPATRDFISVALSGGGSKAAIFSGEALFYLQALGVLQDASIVSAVSGGSFAGALYALSCNSDDVSCSADRPHGRQRPTWQHDTVLATLGQGYGAVVGEQVARLFVPFVPSSITAGRFAQIIDRDYLKGGQGDGQPFRFADVNARRPQIFLNATITSENRGGLGAHPAPEIGCIPLGPRGYLRRRTPDEYFHFAFTDFYFGLLHSSVETYPLAAGIAASAAFPALIDFALLRDHCGRKGVDDTVRLMDGGANDNQALIEIYLSLAELAYGQHRSDLWLRNPGALEALTHRDRAFIFVVNSSVTETTGDAATGGGQQPRGVVDLLSSVLTKVLSATDTASAEGYNLRKQSYLAQAALLRTRANSPALIPVEISLTELDQYWLGGTEAALRYKAGLGAEEGTDFGEGLADLRRARQQRAYAAIVPNAGIRHALGLSDWHPQCYFNMRKTLDASLVSLAPDDQACLRDAARWAAALRGQEMCDAADKLMQTPDGLRCLDRRVTLPFPQALQDAAPLAGDCTNRLRAMNLTPDPTVDQRLQCQPL